MTDTETFRPCDARTILQQVGRANLCAISGGRALLRETGVTLPVGRGYSVTIDLDASDTYVVRRMFKRGAKVWNRGEMRDVYCEDVGDVAYYASCFVNVAFPLEGEL